MQIIAGIGLSGEGVVEPRTVVHIRRCITLPGQVRVKTDIQRVSLIVVNRSKSRRRISRAYRHRSRTNQASRNRRRCLGELIRVRKMKLAAMPEIRRAQREFPALNLGVGPCNRPEDIRFADVVVIQPIAGAGFKVVRVEGPALQRNGDTELPLDVALTVQRSEAEALVSGQILQLVRGRGKRGSRVEVAIEPAELPV